MRPKIIIYHEELQTSQQTQWNFKKTKKDNYTEKIKFNNKI